MTSDFTLKLKVNEEKHLLKFTKLSLKLVGVVYWISPQSAPDLSQIGAAPFPPLFSVYLISLICGSCGGTRLVLTRS
jgi:hypothetical protein